MTVEDEEIPLAPLNELISKFKKRLNVLTLVAFISLPAAFVSIILFFAFFLSFGFSSLAGVIFAFLLLSAVASLFSIVIIPDSLSGILVEMETTAKMTAFTIMRPRGANPQEKLLNQLTSTDLSIKQLLKGNSSLATLNAEVTGRSGSKYNFDVYIHKRRTVLRILGFGDVNVIAKRFDQTEPLREMDIRKFKTQIQDILRSKRVVPTRVILVSTSGYEDAVYKYLGSDEGTFSRRFPSLQCRVELVKENLDGTFDMLFF